MKAIDVLPYLMSAGTITVMWMAGRKWRWTWSLALANQILWIWWQLLAHAWGLFPLSIAMIIIYTRNHFEWNPSHKFWRL